jgi:hypothetical protein
MEAMSRSREGIDTCWRRNRPNYSRKNSQRESYWSQMRWDDEANRWAVFTREGDLTVDRARIRGARIQLDERIEGRYKHREKAARARVSTLNVEIDGLRGHLRILKDESTRQDLTTRLSALERRLRQAFTDERYTLI